MCLKIPATETREHSISNYNIIFLTWNTFMPIFGSMSVSIWPMFMSMIMTTCFIIIINFWFIDLFVSKSLWLSYLFMFDLNQWMIVEWSKSVKILLVFWFHDVKIKVRINLYLVDCELKIRTYNTFEQIISDILVILKKNQLVGIVINYVLTNLSLCIILIWETTISLQIRRIFIRLSI